MKKVLFIILIAIANLGYGQFDLSFYQMGAATPQSNNYNAAFFPKSRVFVSIPGLSGIGLSVHNSFGMTDILTRTGDSTLVDVNRFLANQKNNAYFNTTFSLTDLMVGFRTGDNGFVTVFVNERGEGTAFYPMQLINFIWNGNRNYVGQDYKINDMSYGYTQYREIGVGYGRDFNILGMKTTLGMRVKYLQGLFHSGTSNSINMSIYTAEDYSVQASIKDGAIMNAGLNKLGNGDYSYFIFNQNKGFGVDLGMQMEVTDRLNVSFAANDLGYIHWTEDAEKASFKGTSLNLDGSTFDDLNQLGQAVADSINALKVDTLPTTFNTSLNSKIFLSGSYRLTDNGYAQLTMSNYFTQGRMKSAVGVGYLQNLGKWLAASTTFSLSPQRGVDMGAGLMLRGGAFQTYFNVDNIFNTINIPKATGVNLKFGFNFLFGAQEKKTSKKPQDN